jgi:seryl-tRNA synthetase
MLDIRKIRENPDFYRAETEKKNTTVSIDEVLALDSERRPLLTEAERLRAERNAASKKIGELKKAGENADSAVEEMRKVGERIAEIEATLKELDEQQTTRLLHIPNIASSSTPEGKSAEDNVVVRTWGCPPERCFVPVDHKTLGERLGIFDFERGAKISGSGFPVYRGAGARLERALIQWFLDKHRENGFEEVIPPYLVLRNTMKGTGQLPKFAEDAFAVKDTDYFLIPTAEVPVTNLHRDEILAADQLPIRYCAYSACFRSEAGSAGRDTRGLIRQHQFDKIELVQFVKPEESYAALEQLTHDAEQVLIGLGLPYRVVALSTGDLGFSSAKTYDLEVWMPSYQRYVEISSCSNFEDFQARRAQIRFRRAPGEKPELVHTLNGSGVAVGRTLAAILENYQQADGTITIPEVLRPYMRADRIEMR